MAKPDLVAIVKPEGAWTHGTRKMISVAGLSGGGQVWQVVSARFEILDGPAGAQRKTLSLVVLPAPYKDVPLWPSQRYLVIADRAKDGRLFASNASENPFWSGVFAADPNDDAAVQLILPTHAEHLPQGLKDADLAEAGILDCLKPGDDRSYRTVVALLCTAHPEWKQRPNAMSKDERAQQVLDRATRADVVPYCPEGPLVNRIRMALDATKSDYEKSKLRELLLRWRVPGSLNPYQELLGKLLSVPSAYDLAEEQTGLAGSLEDSFEYGLVDSFEPYLSLDFGPMPFTWTQWLNLVIVGKSPALIAYCSYHFCGSIPPNDIPRYAALLNRTEPDVLYEVTRNLAHQLHDAQHEPRLLGVQGASGNAYPDLPQIVAYWKHYFHIDGG